MAKCPHCGGSDRRLLAPGYFECTSERERLVDVALASSHGGSCDIPVYRTETCGARYQSGGASTGAVQCSCGMFAVGACTECGAPLCGEDARKIDGRVLCPAHASAVVGARENRRRKRADIENRRAQQPLRAWLRSFVEPEERLVAAVTHLTEKIGPRMLRFRGAGWVICDELSPHYELSPGTDLSFPPWDSDALARWFAQRATRAGIKPNDARPTVRTVRKLFGGERTVQGRPEPAWLFDRCGYVLLDGAFHGQYLSGHGLISMGKALGVAPPPEDVAFWVSEQGT